ncbi:MAG TPA: hydantoinase B/oxoprolinase family protein [Chloroflexota bacterium]|nr:hydantoinase B/oxoprolinase family protein [Chloroflexota bacterium]
MMARATFDPISLEIMWSRLISIADEMWTTVLRTAVSTVIGAANDFGCEIMDARGDSLAHAQRSMPVFNLVMSSATRAVMARYPTNSMRPGDVFITNDPWICAGHLYDITVVTPVFRGERVVAFLTTMAHATSIGGSLAAGTVRDMYEEGLCIPICTLYEAGKPNETTFAFIRNNVRTPDMVLMDIEAQVTANSLGAERLQAFLAEYRLADFEALARAVQDRAERAMREAIRGIPNSVYEHEIETDGHGPLAPVRLRCRVQVDDDQITVDYTGSDPQRMEGGINCTLVYTIGHTVYPLKCLLAPSVPNNEGTFRPISVIAPPGSILNCTPPASVNSRTQTGWHLHPLLFGALAGVLPDRVQAGNGLMFSISAYGQDAADRAYTAHFFSAGGRGASQGRDGIGRNCFPSSARNVPIEAFERHAPVLIRERALRPNSAGAGRWRGAFGQQIVVSRLPGFANPVYCSARPDRLRHAPPGLAGGQDGPLTEMLLNGERLADEVLYAGHLVLRHDDDRLTVHLPGGAGFGDAAHRDPASVQADAQAGLIAPEAP